MKSANNSSWKPASDLKHKDIFFSSDMTKGNHNPIHRLNPAPVSSMISVRDENGLDPTLDSIRQICKHYEQKCAGKYDKQSTAGRCLFQLSREVQAILEELEVRFHFQKSQLKHLNDVVSQWDKYYGPQTPESLSFKYKTIPITPKVLKQYISELEDRNALLEQERLNRLEEEKEEVMEIENAIDIHNRVARDQYHTEMKRINLQKQKEVDDLNNKYNKEIKELNEKHYDEIERMKEQHNKEIESYKIQSEKTENDLKKEIDRLNKVIIKQQNEIEEKNEEINTLHSTIEEYTKKLEKLTQELVTIQNEITLVAKNKDEEYKKIIDEMHQQFKERENELLKQINVINDEKDLLKYNLNQLQDILNQLQCQYQENHRQERNLIDISGADITVDLPKIMVSKELRHKIDTQNPPYKNKWNKNCLNLRYSPQKLTHGIKVFYN